MKSTVVSVNLSKTHSMVKPQQQSILLIKGMGVEGDAHFGPTVKHRSRVARDPNQQNLRQVHLIHYELIESLNAKGFALNPGEMGENITTIGLDLLKLPKGTRLRFADAAEIEITGLRNPCLQLDQLRPGLMAETLEKDTDGNLIRKAGVMAIVTYGGTVKTNDPISVLLPAEPYEPLKPV